MYRNSFIEINQDYYLSNINYLKKISNKNIIAILKANGYGIIDYYAAKLAISNGIDLIGVSSLSEAIELREHGIDTDILILGYVDSEYIDIVKKLDLSIVTVSIDQIQNIKKYLNGLKVHLKIDTGMNRIGIYPSEASNALAFLLENGANILGIMTHYANSDIIDECYTAKQFAMFKNVVNSLSFNFKFIHTSNTDAAINFNDDISNYVRCGIGLLGYSSFKSDLKPCVSLKSQIINIKKVKKGCGVSYGHKYISDGKSWIATIPLGYADGILRKNSGRKIYVDGEYAEIIGNICMDQMMILCKNYHKCGTEVEIFGEHIPLEDMAKELDTITYEILVNLSDRITRVYKKTDGTIIKKCTPRFLLKDN